MLARRGFTLIEMIVAIGVFSVAVVFAMSSYLALTNAQKKAVTLQTVQDNLRFTLETMAREIRLGGLYYCGLNAGDPPALDIPPEPFYTASAIPRPTWSARDCSLGSGGGPVLFFRPLTGGTNVIMYRHGTCGATTPSCIEKSTINGTIFDPVTSQNITIEALHFYVVGSPSGSLADQIPARVTIAMKGKAQVGSQVSEFNLSTSVSEREFKRSNQ